MTVIKWALQNKENGKFATFEVNPYTEDISQARLLNKRSMARNLKYTREKVVKVQISVLPS
jgi:DNA-directed RNA polymerase subunit L